MPELYAHQRVELDHDRDWSIPTDLETLRSRPPAEGPDQTRYGRAR